MSYLIPLTNGTSVRAEANDDVGYEFMARMARSMREEREAAWWNELSPKTRGVVLMARSCLESLPDTMPRDFVITMDAFDISGLDYFMTAIKELAENLISFGYTVYDIRSPEGDSTCRFIRKE